MTQHFQTQNAVILSFLPFGGGKFLSNCLSLSKHACPQSAAAAEYLLENPDDYDYRTKTILQTLPPAKKMKDWRAFEFGDRQLYGESFESWSMGRVQPVNRVTKKLCHSDMRFFLTDHSMTAISLSQIWKNAIIIKLINSRRFQDICLLKKLQNPCTDISHYNGNYCQEKYSILRDPDWPTWQEFEKSGYDIRNFTVLNTRTSAKIAEFYHVHPGKNPVLLFDVDCYFDSNRFMSSIKQLYQDLDFTDFQFDLVEYFYKKYVDLHF